MRQKLVAFGDDYWIENGLGQRVYFVDGKAFRLREHLAFKDMHGNELAAIQERVLPIKDTYSVYRYGQALATVKKALIAPFRQRFDIHVAGGDSLEAQGNVLDHEYEIRDGRRRVAEVSKKWFRVADTYGEQSCTAGRSSFITGQSVFRTGLSKVGVPAAPLGLRAEDPTIAELLKPLGYATGQFGKNHLGDRNEFLPTVHGFDEFFGNLYHLNAEDEPENPDYPKNPNFRAQFGPRGVLKCVATATETLGDDPRFGPWGKQKCEATAPLTKKRMETIDEEFLKATTDFIDRAAGDKKPFFVWFN